MREFSNVPWDDGSCRILWCPPSHQEMVLVPHYAHASARAPRPSHLPTSLTVSTGQVSLYHQRGSTMQSAASAAHSSCHIVPFVSMGRECPQARPDDRSDGWMAPLPDSIGASTPSCSPHHGMSFANMGGERTRAGSNNRLYGSMAPLPATTGVATPLPSLASPSLPARSPLSPSTTEGGGYYLTAWTATLLVRVTPSKHPMATVKWAPCANAGDVLEYTRTILEYWDANASPQEKTLCNEDNAGPPLSSRLSPRERLIANEQSGVCRAQWVCTYLTTFVSPSHPHHWMGGSSAGLMAPSLATTGAAMPSPSSARPSPLAWSTPSQPKQTMGGSSEASMAPSSTSSRTAMPLPSLASPSLPACSSSSPPNITGGGASLAHHWAATVLQCWKRCIWLCCWFGQQATLKQKRICLQALCRGASTYVSLVQGNCYLPPPPTKKSSNPKVLNHPFRTRGQPLPPRKMRRRHKPPRCCPGWRHRPRAPNPGGRPSCMPLVFWATQTMAASSLLGGGEPKLMSYISPTSAASTIQWEYRLYLSRCTRRILPCLSGAYKSQPGCTVAPEEWVAMLNASYHTNLASMHKQWAPFPFLALFSYLSNPRRVNHCTWSALSTDWDAAQREIKTRHVLLTESWS